MANLFDDLMPQAAPPAPPPADAPRGGLFDDLPLTRMVAAGAPPGLFDDLKPQAPKQRPGQFDQHIEAAAQKYGIPPALLRAQVGVESSFNPNARSPAGAQGLMQLMPATAKELGVTDPLDPGQNIDGGAKYMRRLLDQVGGDVHQALLAYNGGPGRLAKVGAEGMPAESKSYAQKVLDLAKSFTQPAHPLPTNRPQTVIPAEHRDLFTDVLTAGAQGVADVGSALGGIAGIIAGKNPLSEPQGSQQRLAGSYSPTMATQQQAVQQAQGFLPTAQALVTNPRAAAGMVARSVPQTGIAAMLAALAPGAVAPALAGGVVEGLMSAGGTASQIQGQTGQPLTGQQRLLAAGSGVVTGVLGAVGGRLAQRLGLANPDALFNGGAALGDLGLARRLIGSALSEGGEELAQSSQEQLAQNLATGRPLLENVGAAAAQGGLLGAAMGGMAGGVPARPTPTPDTRQTAVVQPQASSVPAAPPVPPGSPTAPLQTPPSPVAPGIPGEPLLQASTAPATASPSPPAGGAPLSAANAALPGMATGPAQGGASATDGPIPFAGSKDVSQLYRSMDIKPELRDRAMQLLAPEEPSIEAQRRGTMTWEETGKLATLAGTTIDQLKARRVGQPFNAEEFVAASRLLKDKTAAVLDLSQRIKTGTASDIDRANFVQQLEDLKTAQGAVMGSRAEIGRALGIMRANVTDMRQTRRILDSVGGQAGADAIAAALDNAMQRGGVEEAAKLAGKAGGAGFWTFYKSMLLSSPDTHAVNVVGNLATALSQIPERAVAAGIAKLKGSRGEVKLGEPFYQAAGLLEGMVNGMRAAADSWKTGADPFGSNKAESNTNNAPGQKVWGVPLRLLQSEDAFFQMTNAGMEKYALAYRQAAKEGGTVQQVAQRARELIENPTPEITQASEDQALYATFNNEAGKFVQAINNARMAVPYGAGNLVVPFLKTPANILNYAMKRTALAPLYSEVREDIKAGGARQELALARVAVGSVIQGAAAMAYLAGNLTGGGPEDQEKRKAWLAAGNQPYSIKVNGRWVDYSRMDPFASLLGTAADVAEFRQDPDAGIGTITKAVGRNVLSKTWLQGLSGMMQALADPDRYGESWTNRTGATLLQPATLLAHVGRWQDPVQREANGFTESLMYRLPAIPGVTEGRTGLRAKLDAYGQPLLEPARQIGRAGPFRAQEPTQDPVRLEAGRLGWSPAVPDRAVTVRGKQIELDDAEHHQFAELAGRLTHVAAGKVMRAPGYGKLDDNQRKDMLDKAAAGARTAVRLAVIADKVGNKAALEKLRQAITRKENAR